MAGLYVHIPWCVRKCPYCDFNSHELKGELDEQQYTDKLIWDLELEHEFAGINIDTVYFGGGTPSLFHPDSFARVLSQPLLQNVNEATMEANPGTLEHRDFADYRAAGITRVSIGVQSFDAKNLKTLGRIHDAEQARAAVLEANGAGFDDVNLDLMFGLPDQSVTHALQDLQSAIELRPSHISWYELTIEPNTVFAKYPPVLPSLDQRADIAEQGAALLAEHGYERYEVSAYGCDGSRCSHNLNYWRFGDYLGIGAGAHGKVRLGANVVRSAMPKQPRTYMDGRPVTRQFVEHRELPVEFMLNALRLVDGVEMDRYAATTGDSLSSIQPIIAKWRTLGMFVDDRIQLTAQGFLHLDEIVADFMPDEA